LRKTALEIHCDKQKQQKKKNADSEKKTEAKHTQRAE
jgi:hypothetical protein